MTAQITLPRDAEGREISLDTKTLYDGNGKALNVLRWMFLPYADEGTRWRFEYLGLHEGRLPENFYLTPPDSWESLEEDARKAPREYIEGRGITAGRDGRVTAMVSDIVRRAEALAERGTKRPIPQP